MREGRSVKEREKGRERGGGGEHREGKGGIGGEREREST